METFSALLAICAGNSPVTGEFPAQKPVTRSFDVCFDLINGWVNNSGAGDLRRHCAHYDVTVMIFGNSMEGRRLIIIMIFLTFSYCHTEAWTNDE